jgi:ABC-type transport system substrate-binding protein
MSIFGRTFFDKGNSKKLPSANQWLQFFKVLDKKEKYTFFGLLFIFLSSLLFLTITFYHKNTNIVPSNTGSIKIGMLGQPQFINPLYAFSSDVDCALVELTFSSLMDYDVYGNVIPNLIKDYRTTNNGQTIEFSLKENAKWSDGKSITMDDVIFTIRLVQDSDYLSPLRANWQGVEVEKTSDYKGIIKLKQPYSAFLEALASLRIMPEHIWQNATVQAITGNTEYNLISPIGSGPYTIKKVDQRKDKTVKSITMIANKDYYDGQPHIQKVEVIFFDKQEDLANSLKKGAIDAAELENSTKTDLSQFKNFDQYILQTTNYFSVFLNNTRDPFKNLSIRTAIAMAVDKQELVDKALNGKGETIDSPLLPSFYGFSESKNIIAYNVDEANNLFDKEGFILKDGLRQRTLQKAATFQFKQTMQLGNKNTSVQKLQECLAQDPDVYPNGTISGNFGEETKKAVIAFQEKYKDDILVPNGLSAGTGKVSASTIKKLNEICFTVPDQTTSLSFKIKTSNHPALIVAANTLKDQWQKVGIQATVEVLDNTEMKRVIRERDFDALLFGEKLGAIPDPLPYWHSSQVIDPGLNLSLYTNSDLDALLEKQRSYSDYNNPDRTKTLESIQDTLTSAAPAVYLYTSDYIYITNKKIQGIKTNRIVDSSRIFSQIKDWYVGLKREWK